MTRGGVREELKGHNTEHTRAQHKAGRCREKRRKLVFWMSIHFKQDKSDDKQKQARLASPLAEGWAAGPPGRGFQKVKK